MQKMIAADRKSVTVARYDPHVQVRLNELESRRNRGGATVYRMETIGFDVIRKS